MFGTRSELQEAYDKLYAGAKAEMDYNTNAEGINQVRSYLKSLMEGNPNRAKMSDYAKDAIAKIFDRRARTINENIAGSGMGRSGVGSVVQTQLAGEEGQAVASSENRLNEIDAQMLQRAIFGLLGLEENIASQRIAGEQWQQQMEFAKEQSEFDFFRDFLPGLLQGGAQVGSAAIIASDSRFKENINEIGKSKSGIPIVEFNYKGDNRRFIGAIAQNVEKIKPEAVVEDGNGMKYVNYDLIDVDFHEV